MPSVKTKKYPKILAVLRSKTEKEGPLTSDDCKEIIGWTEENGDDNWSSDFVLKDKYGKKIRLLNNPSNRPFKLALANKYANEHLRGKWSLNLETIVVDENGNVPEGQHRLVGFVLAEQQRQINPKRHGKTPLVYETLIGYGVSPKPENANTYGLGSTRTLGDVIYRHQRFSKATSDKEQRKVSKILAGAVRLVWLRVGGQQVSFAPHFPHSEALEFYGKHPKILGAVYTILEYEGGTEKRVSSLLSLSYASALLYLMSLAPTIEKAQEFWSSFASGEGLGKGSPILTLRQLLTRMDASSGSKRDEILGAVIKSWLLWLKNKKVSGTKEIKVARKKEGDRFILSEFPRIGGIDSPIKNETVELTQHQLLILSILKTEKKEVTYKHLQEKTGLQLGSLSTAIMSETKQGKKNPHSLMSRQLVSGSQHEDTDYLFQLTAKGLKWLS